MPVYTCTLWAIGLDNTHASFCNNFGKNFNVNRVLEHCSLANAIQRSIGYHSLSIHQSHAGIESEGILLRSWSAVGWPNHPSFRRGYTYRILQRHRAVSLPQHGFLVGLYLQTADNAGLFTRVSEEVATEIVKNCHRWQPHCRLTLPPRGTHANYSTCIVVYISRN